MSDSTTNQPPPEVPESPEVPDTPAQHAEICSTEHRVVLHRDGERWEFGWDEGDAREMVLAVSELPAHPRDEAFREQSSAEAEIVFDWFDAAVVCRQIAREAGLSPPGEEESDSFLS